MSLLDVEVTRRKLGLSAARDTVTGWYTKEFTPSTIEMLIMPRTSSFVSAVFGTYARTDFIGFTQDGVVIGDEVLLGSNYYEVKSTRPQRIADSFSHREVDMTFLPLHELSYDPAAPSVNDARYNTKDYLETRITDSNMQTTGGRNLRWIACYSNPDYPLLRVFIDKRMEIIFTIDTPDSEPKMNYDQTPYGYKERVPIHIVTLDTEVNHLAETELRNVTESYPTGSQRGLERRGTTVHNYGSTQVFDTEFVLNYSRGTT